MENKELTGGRLASIQFSKPTAAPVKVTARRQAGAARRHSALMNCFKFIFILFFTVFDEIEDDGEICNFSHGVTKQNF